MTGGEAIEATIAGDYFSDPHGRADWVWQDFYLNGVKWKYGRIPELPLIQPEKVTQLPLDIHLTNDTATSSCARPTSSAITRTKSASSRRRTRRPTLPLYRGTVWIDTKTWARVRLSMVQLNLTGEILSNEERVDFQPFARATHAPLTRRRRGEERSRAKSSGCRRSQRAAGRLRGRTRERRPARRPTFTDFRIEPPDYETQLAEAEESDARMVRETEGRTALPRDRRGDRRARGQRRLRHLAHLPPRRHPSRRRPRVSRSSRSAASTTSTSI